MSSLRQHGTTLIAGLLFLGVLGVMSVAARAHVDLGPIARGGVWFVAAFVAAHISRRVLLDLDTSSLCAAAVVVSAIAIGVDQKRAHEPIDISILVYLGLALAGTLVGAFTSRPAATVRRIFAILGAGAISFGACVLGVGISLAMDGEPVVAAVFIAAPVGAMCATWFSDLESLDTALGLSLFYVGLGVITTLDLPSILAAGIIGSIFGWLLGAVGGAIGVRLRGSRRSAQQPDLPKARKID